MKKHYILSFVFLLPVQVWGASDQAALKQYLDAPIVKQVIVNAEEPTKLKCIFINNETAETKKLIGVDCGTKRYLVTNSAEIFIKNYNPLTSRFVADNNSDKETIFETKEFSDLFTKSFKDVMKVPAADLSKLSAANQSFAFQSEGDLELCDQVIDTLKHLEDQIKLQESSDGSVSFSKSDLYPNKINIEAWKKTAVNKDGLDKILTEIERFISNISKNVTSINKDINVLVAYKDKASTPCATPLSPVLVGKIADDVKTAVAITDERESLKNGLQKLAGLIDEHKAKYVTNGLYPIGAYAPSTAESTTVKITYIPKELSIDGNKLTLTEKDNKITTELSFHKQTTWVPDIGVSLIWSDVKYKKFGVKTEGGKTVVADGTAGDHFHGALTLNYLFTNTDTIYPLLQLGVASSTDYPAFVFGGGFKFMGSFPITVTGGGFLGFYKEPKTLKPGDEVAGTDAVDKDLTTNPRLTFYIGIQHTF